MPASVRVNERTWSILKEIADNVGETMQSVLEKAIESYRRQWILQQTNEAYAALRNDESAWQEELAERRLWDSSLSDGLGGDDLETKRGEIWLVICPVRGHEQARIRPGLILSEDIFNPVLQDSLLFCLSPQKIKISRYMLLSHPLKAALKKPATLNARIYAPFQ